MHATFQSVIWLTVSRQSRKLRSAANEFKRDRVNHHLQRPGVTSLSHQTVVSSLMNRGRSLGKIELVCYAVQASHIGIIVGWYAIERERKDQHCYPVERTTTICNNPIPDISTQHIWEKLREFHTEPLWRDRPCRRDVVVSIGSWVLDVGNWTGWREERKKREKIVERNLSSKSEKTRISCGCGLPKPIKQLIGLDLVSADTYGTYL